MFQFTLRKSRHIMQKGYHWYSKVYRKLPDLMLEELERDLQDLDLALLARNRKLSNTHARKIRDFWLRKVAKEYKGSHPLLHFLQFLGALIFAFAIAVVIRQMWFEPYQIPTGSMRPTFKEQDHLTVTKTPFGINFPLLPGHFYFAPEEVERTSIVIWSGDNIDLPDTDDLYFYLIPYKRQYVKRLIGKPGDALYFYGGRIYGVDKDGNPIKELLDETRIGNLEYIPFITFEGRIRQNPLRTEVYFKHFNKDMGRLLARTMTGEVWNRSKWVADDPMAQASPHSDIETFSDWLGIRGYAMAALLKKQDLPTHLELPDAPLYLQLLHTPSMARLDLVGNIGFNPYTAYIPLEQKHLNSIMDHLYTARFFIQDERGGRYSPSGFRYSTDNPSFPQVADGTYEFYYGKGYQIGLGAIAYELPKEHPLNARTPENVQKLFNYGIDLTRRVDPAQEKNRMPRRYAYFRNGDLYLMGAPILKKDDPALIAFHKREKEKQQKATPLTPYTSFGDLGPPVNDNGSLNTSFIKEFGIHVPEGHYLVLGDNHAMSADSRDFGFVPKENLKGSPSLLLWPPGERWGLPNQPRHALFTVPRLIVWAIALVASAIAYAIHRRRISKPIFKKLSR